jgi:hypothetical protein
LEGINVPVNRSSDPVRPIVAKNKYVFLSSVENIKFIKIINKINPRPITNPFTKDLV